MRVIDKKTFRQMPWANGLGVTTELCLHKDAASGRMLWRLSMAGVDTDGPFSNFAGYDRVLVLLEGEGMILSHGDGTRQVLSAPYDMACFAGDAQTSATLPGGPIRDFNVITDRASFRPRVEIVSSVGRRDVKVAAQVLAVYAVEGELQIVEPGKGGVTLPAGDLLLVEGPVPGSWGVSGATAIVVQLSPCAG